MSLTNYIPFKSRANVSRLWNDAKSAKRMAGEPDLETIRKRALHDARGQIIRHGATYSATGVTHWHIRRSIAGRTTQFDLVANGELVATAGPRKMPRRFRP